MKLELEIQTASFGGLCIDIPSLNDALVDPNHFYRFVNDGETISIEKYDLKDIDFLGNS